MYGILLICIQHQKSSSAIPRNISIAHQMGNFEWMMILLFQRWDTLAVEVNMYTHVVWKIVLGRRSWLVSKWLLSKRWHSKVFGGLHQDKKTIWWFQICFIFTPIWGRFPFWLIFFRWVGSTTSQKRITTQFDSAFSGGLKGVQIVLYPRTWGARWNSPIWRRIAASCWQQKSHESTVSNEFEVWKNWVENVDFRVWFFQYGAFDIYLWNPNNPCIFTYIYLHLPLKTTKSR